MDYERDLSEFNGSQLKLLRIDEILKGIIECRHNLNIHQWLFYIQDFDMELESVKKKEEQEELEIQMKKLVEEVNSYLQMKNNSRLKHKSTPVELIEHLNQYQKALLKIYKTSGMEMKLQEGAMGGFGK